MTLDLTRRAALAGLMATGATMAMPQVSFAATGGDKRLVFVIQRGAADGLGVLAPVADPIYAKLRGELAEEYQGVPQIGGLFALHPALKRIGALFDKGEALFAHAVGLNYRDRSHFDAQNVLESGGTAPYAQRDGWMNRLLPMLPENLARGIALAATVPLAMRGDVNVASYAPSNLPDADAELLQRVTRMYDGDPQLSMLWDEAKKTRMLAEEADADIRGPQASGALAATMLAPADGARVAMIETNGWDTHSAQANRLRTQLRGLDALTGALMDGLGDAWDDTLVIVATEFGRTAKANGTRGTDHGTGSMAMLMGGAIKGGRIVGDWPGLRESDLYAGRDLMPTTSLEGLISSAVAEHFALDPQLASKKLFPGQNLAMMSGLVTA